MLMIVVLLITSCKKEVKKELALGDWRAEMEVSEGKSLPFNFTLSKDGEGNYIMKMYNAEEEVVVDEFNFDFVLMSRMSSGTSVQLLST